MTSATLLWTEYPYQAGFCITDDTDDATLPQVKAVYDFLIKRNFPTTKTVWPFKAVAPSGIPPTPESTLRGITLEDPEYLEYCAQLAGHGFEICLHGASAGNNKRDATRKAFDFLESHFGGSDTFICHSKNAENIYWGGKVTRLFPFNLAGRFLGRHAFSGEDETSAYFWGDLCRQKINQIRLFRTRRCNTLKRNPSMPYHDPRKPFVNHWFSATKRSIADCATRPALDRLKAENGLTVLYQYLHRYADPRSLELHRGFVTAVETLSGDGEIHIATVSSHMRRLRMMRGASVLFRGPDYWLVNSNDTPLRNVQFALTSSADLHIEGEGLFQEGNRLVFPEIPAKGLLHWKCPGKIAFAKCAAKNIPPGADLPLRVDIEVRRAQAAQARGLPLLEEYGLILDQFRIIAREILFQGRSMDSDKFLDAGREIRLENHDNW